ncbi:hypothetical protein, partial [Pseudomonas sp. GOM6]|uniref:hypothetical protein n=1 Tax=Pseudomonas sp. GOM6 TaxID=3036944 RepID=UPI00240A5744
MVGASSTAVTTGVSLPVPVLVASLFWVTRRFTADAENDAVTVSFNTNSAHYILSNGQVVLTQAGVDV